MPSRQRPVSLHDRTASAHMLILLKQSRPDGDSNHLDIAPALQQTRAPLGPIYRKRHGAAAIAPESTGGQLPVPAGKIYGAGANHRAQCSHAQAPNFRPCIFRNGGRSQSTEHEAHAPHQHLLPLDPYIGQTLAPSLRVRRQTKVQPTIPNPHNPTMAAQVIPAHPLNIRIT